MLNLCRHRLLSCPPTPPPFWPIVVESAQRKNRIPLISDSCQRPTVKSVRPQNQKHQALKHTRDAKSSSIFIIHIPDFPPSFETSGHGRLPPSDGPIRVWRLPGRLFPFGRGSKGAPESCPGIRRRRGYVNLDHRRPADRLGRPDARPLRRPASQGPKAHPWYRDFV